MNKDLKKEANKILLHLSKQCFELRVSSIIQNHPEQVEQLKHEEAFMMNTYKDSIKVAKQMFPKEGANKQVISSQADSLIKISRIWAD
ncbi:hypothetical protein AAGO99_26445, partial [Klebsiella pneumoniae]